MFIVIDDVKEGLIVGKIKLILIHRDPEVCFITEKYLTVGLPNIGVAYLTPNKTCLISVLA